MAETPHVGSRTVTFKIKTLNKISPKGLELFVGDYSVSDGVEKPDAIVVRSAQVDTDTFDGLLAVARAGAGVNNITIDKASAKGVCVFNTPGANANAVAELVFIGLGLALRNVDKALAWINTLRDMTDAKEMDAKVEKGKSQFAGAELRGKTLGVIGLGKIGVLTANAAMGLGMKVIAYEPFPSPANMHRLDNSVKVTAELSAVIGAADFLTVHIPLNDKTRGLLNAKTLATFNGSVLLNFSRGPVVDNDSIAELLKQGKLKAYVNDFPHPAILNLPGVICLPHLGASTEEAEETCAVMAVEQVKDYLEIGTIKNSVNLPSVNGGRPAGNVKVRLCIINQDVPNMIAEITRVIGGAGLNIVSFKNESNGKLGYNLIDLDATVPDTLTEQLTKLDKVVKVRRLNFA
jgi:D-3-phosphoglycerate dehydrogenase / 2-oxoglutarate reductase